MVNNVHQDHNWGWVVLVLNAPEIEFLKIITKNPGREHISFSFQSLFDRNIRICAAAFPEL